MGRSHGLVRSDAAAERYVYSQVAESAAYGFPNTHGDDLDLCFDLLGWFFDDQFDARDGRDGAALDSCDRLTDLVHGAPLPADAPPILTSFAECWERMTRGMSRTWRRRTAHDWADYLSGSEVHSVEKDTAGGHPNLALSIARHRGISNSSSGTDSQATRRALRKTASVET